VHGAGEDAGDGEVWVAVGAGDAVFDAGGLAGFETRMAALRLSMPQVGERRR